MALPRKCVRLFGFLVVGVIGVYTFFYYAHDFVHQCSPVLLARKFNTSVALRPTAARNFKSMRDS